MNIKISKSLNNLEQLFPVTFTPEQAARAKTLFYKNLSLSAHRFYNGKMQTIPKAGLFGFNWFNTWYTPGVSAVSTGIRDNNEISFEVSNRGNFVAIVSDSTRVLGDGNCSPAGGLGVMEGKAFLMKYLGAVDAVALCIDSRNNEGKHDPDKIIDFVKMAVPSFGAINLEDISQPNCFKVLDTLREQCEIPVWHDDQQGTACVTLGALFNALKLVNKNIGDVKIVYYGAGASNTMCANLIIKAGGNPENMIMFDSRGALHSSRDDIKADKAFYRKWELCEITNPKKVNDIAGAMKQADVLISLSTPGPDTIKPEWIRSMADKSIVFACANPIPEIYPYAAKEAGAYIVATGRGDFPNQVNNSVGFPGILKGALLVRAKKITDEMAIAASRSLADYAEKRGINPESIVPLMDEPDLFPKEAVDVAMQAINDGVARKNISADDIFNTVKEEIRISRSITEELMKQNYIKEIPESLIQDALNAAINNVSSGK